MAASTLVNMDILHKFGIDKLKLFQEQTLDHLLKGEDVFLCKKTGGGKSLCYQLFQPCWSLKHGEMCQVLVVSPLISIMKEQSEFLTSVGFTATYIGRDSAEDDTILTGNFQFVFTSPESILGVSKWNDMLRSTDTIKLLVIDEAHTVLHWGQSEDSMAPFRPWYSKLGEIRSLLNCPMLLITATANNAARKKLKGTFCMKNCYENIDNPDRHNIKLFVQKCKSSISSLSEVFYFLIDFITRKRESCERFIVFCQTIKTCSEVYTMFRLELDETLMQHVEMYHSQTTETVKDDVKENMNDPNGTIRILIATSAAGMGVNFKGLKHVVHFGPPKDMDMFVQQYGRAGRDGKYATEMLLYNGQQTKSIDADMKEYTLNVNVCRRQLILNSYDAHVGQSVKHLCCDICDKDCNCGDTSCLNFNHPYFDVEIPSFSESPDKSFSDSESL